ncbi:hypothetical protein DEM34_17310 [Spiribacter halobius]|uniref:Transcriptional regulator n=2 Tax=Sediminicurvatus halobius TaxID=2182432 RepID=A0A2U2MWQ0_9GAMM|nr:hypothetical protein DEM34_17310 [Spiribacter halobius]
MEDSLPARRRKRQRALLARLSRIEGQLRGVRRMIDEDSECEAVAQQLAASRKALDRAFYEMIACAMEVEALPEDSSEETRERLEALTRLLARYG